MQVLTVGVYVCVAFSPQVVRESTDDKVTVVGAGVTLEEAIKAHETLKGEGINIRVVDPFTLKPIDKELLIKCAQATGGRVVTVEDHYDQGEPNPYHSHTFSNTSTEATL